MHWLQTHKNKYRHKNTGTFSTSPGCKTCIPNKYKITLVGTQKLLDLLLKVMTRYDVKTHIDNKEQILCNVVDCENSFETFRVDVRLLNFRSIKFFVVCTNVVDLRLLPMCQCCTYGPLHQY